MFKQDSPEAAYPFSRGRCTAPEWQEPVEEYLTTLRARQYSPQSVKKRADDLRKLLVYLHARGLGGLADVDLQTLEAYRLALVEHGYGDSAVESALRAASLFFRFLEERDRLFENPARRLKIPKAPVILGTVLTEKEMGQVLAQPDLSTPQGLRDRALLETLYSTGIRTGEAVALKVFDVQLAEAAVNVTGKGRKQRWLPLGKHAVKYLRLYLKEARPKFYPKFCPAPDALWLDRRRQGLSGQSLTRLVGQYGQAANLGKRVDIHTIRRTCATQLLRGGAHPVAVAQLLGHSGLRSLSHYLRTTIGDLQKSHARSRPGR